MRTEGKSMKLTRTRETLKIEKYENLSPLHATLHSDSPSMVHADYSYTIPSCCSL